MQPDYPVIDAHVHITFWGNAHPEVKAMAAEGKDFAAIESICNDPHRLVAYMDERNIERLVMINYIAPEVIGFTEEVNAFSSNMARAYPERLIPFGGIDPRRHTDVA